MDEKEKEAEIIVSNNETVLVQPQQYIPEKTDSLLIEKILKRLIDIFGGIVGTIVLVPLTIGIAIANLICKDNGPIFYSQYRMGKNGKLFKMYKYRSMVTNAEELIKQFTPEQMKEYKENFKLENDPRITKVGKFLRKTSLDELPQLLNIIQGDLALIGPRPVVKKELEKYGKNAGKFLSVTPGLTGNWAASGRSNTTYEERMKMELWYVDNISFITDVKIFFKTIIAVIKKEGAK